MHSKRKNKTAFFLLILIAAFLALGIAGMAQDNSAGSDATAANGEEIIPFLNQTIEWYRQITVQQQLATEPSDVLFLNDNRQIADQVVRLSFDYARSRAQALNNEAPTSTSGQGGKTSQYQRLADAANKADQQVKTSQQEIDTQRQKLATATGKNRRELEALIAETQSELELFQARRDVLRSMLQFATGASGAAGGGSLSARIDELAKTVPVASVNPKGTTTDNGPAQTNTSNNLSVAAKERKEEPTGMLALIEDIISVRRKLTSLEDNIRLTDGLAQTSKDLRTPMLAKVRELTQKGNNLAAQPDSTDSAALLQQQKDLQSLTQEYKQLSASVLPLGKQNILLDLYKRSMTNWRNAVDSEYRAEIKGLMVRLGVLAVILGVILGVFELWRRAIYRYIAEPRRRYQFLLLRRIVLWIVIAIVIGLAFASELGAVTTFAGLLTAGIAVALQNVILSVAGYFFLVGKYGVRVGDRVQVSGVTGDVVDIGLVRLHLMEVTGGATPRPTGRVVVFSNAVVFQANAGLFKQIPGTSFLWHEITLTLGPETDYRAAEKRLLEAVNHVYDEYREKMELQRRSMERALNTAGIREFAPESHLHITGSGLEVVIRYPVELSTAADIDDRVTRALIENIEREPRLRLLGSTIKTEEPAAVE
ncbi:MAG TPA: mechanosensitive ion channel family protein [Candidatus Angelobacter sp.]|nr:mechanosensitive ion channel family protein [Candidatus Angelobacter sp.]